MLKRRGHYLTINSGCTQFLNIFLVQGSTQNTHYYRPSSTADLTPKESTYSQYHFDCRTLGFHLQPHKLEPPCTATLLNTPHE